MKIADFAIVGSSAGGGTIAWLLARAGFDVVVLEQGDDWAKPLDDGNLAYNPIPHDEYRFRIGRPELKRRLRGDYNTYRSTTAQAATPIGGGWTGSMLGGGSVIWGAWGFRALPIDFKLGTHYRQNGQEQQLKDWKYALVDWPIEYAEMEPYYNVAETLLAISGDRPAVNAAVTNTAWYKHFAQADYFAKAGNWQPTFPFPCSAYPRTPVGEIVCQGFAAQGWAPTAPLPCAIVTPGLEDGYPTREFLASAIKNWPGTAPPEFWQANPDTLWSERIRSACNMCGFCGEYLCWGKDGPKSGTRASTLKELGDMPNAEVITNARVYDILYDPATQRATGVSYYDVSDPDTPRAQTQLARHVIVSCGAVQSARLLLMSGPPGGLGNRSDQVGRNVMFHLFGLGAVCVMPSAFQGLLHGEIGNTGNVVSYEQYFVKDNAGAWWKGGTLVSTATKNPLEGAINAMVKGNVGSPLIKAMEANNRRLEVRLTGDDLPMPDNRVELDPSYVDEYGFPVARITRNFGPHERLVFTLTRPLMEGVFAPFNGTVTSSDGNLALIGDHQMGTCRMGDDPAQSVVDRYCRLHDVPNVFVVDTSFMPTGFGLNPLVTTMANALRVGTWIVQQSRQGTGIG
jgi:choline dehydrogenase-like flavoprotein